MAATSPRVVIVTGAARGYGNGQARGLAALGWHVCLTDLPSAELTEAGEELAAIAASAGVESMALPCDVTDYAAVEATVRAVVDAWGGVHLAIANAAVLTPMTLADTSPERWSELLAVNLSSVFHLWRGVWESMAAQPEGGHLLAIASGASVRGGAGNGVYVAAKHAIEGLVKSIAAEGREVGISVNSIGPGCTLTPTGCTREQATTMSKEQLSALFPMGASDPATWVDPATLAPAFDWLASQPGCKYTGLRFDGGPLAQTLREEGYDFEFAPEKVTTYPDEMHSRL